MSSGEHKTAEEASDFVVDSLRQLLTVLGSLLDNAAGVKAVADAKDCRSVPAISKALRRLWYDTPLSAAWDSKEEALWTCHLLCVSEGSRAGLLSFYGAGFIVCSVLVEFAKSALEEKGLTLDEAWIDGILIVERVLRGRHFEQMQKWPADRRCGGGKTSLLCTSRLPVKVRRELDLEGKKLNKLHLAGLGAAMIIPGSFTVGFGVIGAGLIYKKARSMMNGENEKETDPWQRIQSQCMQQAHSLVRRKNCPVEVRYVPGHYGLPKVRVCLYSVTDTIFAIPVGGFNGDGEAVLEGGCSCALRPHSDANSFRLRVYKPNDSGLPAGVGDTALNVGVEVKRGDHIGILTAETGDLRFFADRRTPGAASSNSPVHQSPDRERLHDETAEQQLVSREQEMQALAEAAEASASMAWVQPQGGYPASSSNCQVPSDSQTPKTTRDEARQAHAEAEEREQRALAAAAAQLEALRFELDALETGALSSSCPVQCGEDRHDACKN